MIKTDRYVDKSVVDNYFESTFLKLGIGQLPISESCGTQTQLNVEMFISANK